MKNSKSLIIVLLVLLVATVFIGGVLVGNVYNVTDFLCPARAEPHYLEQDFMSKDGIVIPAGTVIALRKCAYMQRFDYQFAIDNVTGIKQHASTPDTRTGFAELYPVNQ